MTNYNAKRKEKSKEKSKKCNVIKIDSFTGYNKNRIADEIKNAGVINIYTPGEYIEKAINGKKEGKLYEEYTNNKRKSIYREIDLIYRLYIEGAVFVEFPITIKIDKMVMEYNILRYMYNKFKIPFKIAIDDTKILKGNLKKEEVKEYIANNLNSIELLCYLFEYGAYAIENGKIVEEKYVEKELEKISDEITEYLKLVPPQKRILCITRPCIKSEEKIYKYIDEETGTIYMVIGNFVIRVIEDIELDNGTMLDNAYNSVYEMIRANGSLPDCILYTFSESIMQNDQNNFYEIYVPQEKSLKAIKKEIEKYNNLKIRKVKNNLDMILLRESTISNGFETAVIRNEQEGYIRKIIINIEDQLQKIGVDTIIIESTDNSEIQNSAYITIYNNDIIKDIDRYLKTKIIDIKNYRENYDIKNHNLEKHIRNNIEVFRHYSNLYGNYYAYLVLDNIVEKIIYKVQLKANLSNDNVAVTAYESEAKIQYVKVRNEKKQ